MGQRYVEPVTDTLPSIYEEMVPTIPVIFLLSVGADPTEGIMQLCRKKKSSCHAISMGEGQRAPALEALASRRSKELGFCSKIASWDWTSW